MKKWIAIFAVLICCLVYAIAKLSVSEYQTISQDPNTTTQARQTPSARQTDAGSTDKATPEENSGSPVPADQVEALTKVFGEFLGALKSEDYEQAWKLTSESFKSKGSFEKFKEMMASDEAALIMESIIRPESATKIDGRVRVRTTYPSEEQGMYFFFVQEDGQWKLWGF